MYGRKKKPNQVKVMKKCTDGECQHQVPKAVEESKKVKPKEVFGSGYKSKPTLKSKK